MLIVHVKSNILFTSFELKFLSTKIVFAMQNKFKLDKVKKKERKYELTTKLLIIIFAHFLNGSMNI